MADTIRQKIVTALKTQLELIQISGGYVTDAGSYVFEWRQYPVAEAETAIIIRDKLDETEKNETYLFDRRLNIEIAVVTSGTTAVNVARQIMGDIEKAIGTDTTLNKNAYDIEYVGDNMEVNHVEDIFVDVLINIRVYYKTDAWNPLKIINS